MTYTIREILEGPLNNSFRKFVDKSLCSENLDFYEAVETYRTNHPGSDHPSSAQSIYDTFIATGSEKEINIEHSTRVEIQNNLSSARTDLFDRAVSEITTLLTLDVLPRFIRSINETISPSSIGNEANESNEVDDRVEIGLENGIEEPDHPLPINKENWIRKTKELTPVAMSICLSNLIYVMNGLILLMFVGRLGGVASASAGLGNFFIAVTGLSICHGVLGAEDTLCSQAFGAKNFQRVSIIFQRSMMIILVIFIPIGIMWLFTEPLLLALGQDKDVSKIAGNFVLIYLPSLPAFVINECLKRYLCSQGIAYPELIATLSANIIALTFGYFMILRTSVGLYGMPIALGVSNVLTLAFLTGWMLFQKLHVATWRTITLAELFDWHEIVDFLKLGGPAALMMCAQWVGIELHGIMAGWISVSALAAQAAIMNSNAAVFSIALGGAISVGVSVGNQMGAGRFREAVLAYLIGLFDFEILAVIIATTLFLIRNMWSRLFSNDPAVYELVAKAMPLWALFILSDAGSGVGGGAIRGVGEQAKAAICHVVCFYVIGIPLGYYLAFPIGMNLGLPGLWIGITVASYSVACLINGILIFGNWEFWAIRAKKRSELAHTPKTNDSIETGISTGPSRNSVELWDINLSKVDASVDLEE